MVLVSVPVSTFKGIDENLALSSELPSCSQIQNAVMQYAWPATIIINHLIHHLNQVVNYRGLPFPSAWVSVLLPCAIGCLPLETGRVIVPKLSLVERICANIVTQMKWRL